MLRIRKPWSATSRNCLRICREGGGIRVRQTTRQYVGVEFKPLHLSLGRTFTNRAIDSDEFEFDESMEDSYNLAIRRRSDPSITKEPMMRTQETSLSFRISNLTVSGRYREAWNRFLQTVSWYPNIRLTTNTYIRALRALEYIRREQVFNEFLAIREHQGRFDDTSLYLYMLELCVNLNQFVRALLVLKFVKEDGHTMDEAFFRLVLQVYGLRQKNAADTCWAVYVRMLNLGGLNFHDPVEPQDPRVFQLLSDDPFSKPISIDAFFTAFHVFGGLGFLDMQKAVHEDLIRAGYTSPHWMSKAINEVERRVKRIQDRAKAMQGLLNPLLRSHLDGMDSNDVLMFSSNAQEAPQGLLQSESESQRDQFALNPSTEVLSNPSSYLQYTLAVAKMSPEKFSVDVAMKFLHCLNNVLGPENSLDSIPGIHVNTMIILLRAQQAQVLSWSSAASLYHPSQKGTLKELLPVYLKKFSTSPNMFPFQKLMGIIMRQIFLSNSSNDTISEKVSELILENERIIYQDMILKNTMSKFKDIPNYGIFEESNLFPQQDNDFVDKQQQIYSAIMNTFIYSLSPNSVLECLSETFLESIIKTIKLSRLSLSTAAYGILYWICISKFGSGSLSLPKEIFSYIFGGNTPESSSDRWKDPAISSHFYYLSLLDVTLKTPRIGRYMVKYTSSQSKKPDNDEGSAFDPFYVKDKHPLLVNLLACSHFWPDVVVVGMLDWSILNSRRNQASTGTAFKAAVRSIFQSPTRSLQSMVKLLIHAAHCMEASLDVNLQQYTTPLFIEAVYQIQNRFPTECHSNAVYVNYSTTTPAQPPSPINLLVLDKDAYTSPCDMTWIQYLLFEIVYSYARTCALTGVSRALVEFYNRCLEMYPNVHLSTHAILLKSTILCGRRELRSALREYLGWLQLPVANTAQFALNALPLDSNNRFALPTEQSLLYLYASNCLLINSESSQMKAIGCKLFIGDRFKKSERPPVAPLYGVTLSPVCIHFKTQYPLMYQPSQNQLPKVTPYIYSIIQDFPDYNAFRDSVSTFFDLLAKDVVLTDAGSSIISDFFHDAHTATLQPIRKAYTNEILIAHQIVPSKAAENPNEANNEPTETIAEANHEILIEALANFFVMKLIRSGQRHQFSRIMKLIRLGESVTHRNEFLTTDIEPESDSIKVDPQSAPANDMLQEIIRPLGTTKRFDEASQTREVTWSYEKFYEGFLRSKHVPVERLAAKFHGFVIQLPNYLQFRAQIDYLVFLLRWKNGMPRNRNDH